MIGAFGGASAGRGRMRPGVTIAGPGNWTFNNIPSGFVHLTTQDSSALSPVNNGVQWTVSLQNADNLPYLVTAATPVGSQLIRQPWAGVEDAGDGPWVRNVFPRRAELYYGSIQRFSPDWLWAADGHGCKLHVFHTGSMDPANGDWSASSWIGCGKHTLNGLNTTCFQWGDQMDRSSQGLWEGVIGSGAPAFFDGNGDRIDQCPNSVGIVNGNWYKLELHIRYANPTVVKIWVNDLLVNDSTNACTPVSPYDFPQAQEPGAGGVRQGATLGGGSGLGTGGVPLTSDYYIDYALSTLYEPPTPTVYP